MYGIFAYIYAMFGVNVGKYSSTMEHFGIVFMGCTNEQTKLGGRPPIVNPWLIPQWPLRSGGHFSGVTL